LQWLAGDIRVRGFPPATVDRCSVSLHHSVCNSWCHVMISVVGITFLVAVHVSALCGLLPVRPTPIHGCQLAFGIFESHLEV